MARVDFDKRSEGDNPFSSSGRRKMRAYFDAKAPKVARQASEDRRPGVPWRWIWNKSRYVAVELLGAIRNPVPVEFNSRDELPTMLWPDAGGLSTTSEARRMVDRATSPQKRGDGTRVDPEDLLQLMAYPTNRKFRERRRSVSRGMPSPIPEDEVQATVGEKKSRKEEEIQQAIDARDRQRLQQLAASKLGLVNNKLRREAWAMLLHAEKNHDKRAKVSSHRSDRTVEKECAQAFATYPKKLTEAKRQQKQGELAQLIKAIFQREPQLAHFQGFRDVAGCFLLVMGRRRVANALQNAALFHFRDIMLGSLTTVLREMELGMGILAREDPALARFLSDAGVQYYYGIAWVLSWTARCVPTLAVAARVFDAFLCASPIFPTYFMTALTLSRSSELMRLPREKFAVQAALTRYPGDADIERILASATDLFETHPPEKSFPLWKAELGPNTCTQRYNDDWVSIRTARDYQASYARVQGYIRQKKPVGAKQEKPAPAKPKPSLLKKAVLLVLFLGVVLAGAFVATKVQIQVTFADDLAKPQFSEAIPPVESEVVPPQDFVQQPETATEAPPVEPPPAQLPDIAPYLQLIRTRLPDISPYLQQVGARLPPSVRRVGEKLPDVAPLLQTAGTKLQAAYPYFEAAGTKLLPYAQRAGQAIQDTLSKISSKK